MTYSARYAFQYDSLSSETVHFRSFQSLSCVWGRSLRYTQCLAGVRNGRQCRADVCVKVFQQQQTGKSISKVLHWRRTNCCRLSCGCISHCLLRGPSWLNGIQRNRKSIGTKMCTSTETTLPLFCRFCVNYRNGLTCHLRDVNRQRRIEQLSSIVNPINELD